MDNGASSSTTNWDGGLTLVQKVIVVTIMSVCSTGIVLLCSYMCCTAFVECQRWRRRHEYLDLQQHHHHDQEQRRTAPECGLDRDALEAMMPVFVYGAARRGAGEGRPECAVCLGEFGEGEKGRVLPLCRHTFHKECIDMWLYSHTTCPLCRGNIKSKEHVVDVISGR